MDNTYLNSNIIKKSLETLEYSYSLNLSIIKQYKKQPYKSCEIYISDMFMVLNIIN